MGTAGSRLEWSRNMLSQTIVESLKSWPEFQRRIFIETHYGGRSVAEIAGALHLRPSEVVEILQQCERRLYRALKAFRDGTTQEESEEPPEPPDRVAACCCL